MTKHEKLIDRFLLKPKDFSWDELIKLLTGFGYTLVNAGKTSGSRVRFIHPALSPVILHRPHPRPVLKRYQLDNIFDLLKQEGLI